MTKSSRVWMWFLAVLVAMAGYSPSAAQQASKRIDAGPYFGTRKPTGGVRAPSSVTLASVESERLDAGDYFGTGGPPVTYIELDSTQVLVFNAQHGDYVLGGRNLDIDAPTVEVIGNVVIRAYRAGEHAPDENGVSPAGPNGPNGGACGRNGCPGSDGGAGIQGPAGTKGNDGVHIKLKIKTLTGTGTLTVIDDGAAGGRGGNGGAGGNGGDGGKGAARSCGDWLGRDKDGPGDGGAPGNGGVGGIGGYGGYGGAAGNIDYSKDLKAYIESGRMKLEAKAGDPGPGGPGGFGGNGGTRGDGGDGASCGGGGTPGRPPKGADRRNERAGTGPQRERGPDGIIACYNCQQQ